MFFVIDKSKILSYVVAICTVVILFMLASGGEETNSITTSANVVENSIVEQNVINIDKNETKNIISNVENNISQNMLNNI